MFDQSPEISEIFNQNNVYVLMIDNNDKRKYPKLWIRFNTSSNRGFKLFDIQTLKTGRAIEEFFRQLYHFLRTKYKNEIIMVSNNHVVQLIKGSENSLDQKLKNQIVGHILTSQKMPLNFTLKIYAT